MGTFCFLHCRSKFISHCSRSHIKGKFFFILPPFFCLTNSQSFLELQFQDGFTVQNFRWDFNFSLVVCFVCFLLLVALDSSIGSCYVSKIGIFSSNFEMSQIRCQSIVRSKKLPVFFFFFLFLCCLGFKT